MNLRNAQNYSIGLDLGTGSVGWAVIDENGELLSFKKRAAWGSRIFPSALPASEARGHRGQRRRYERRRQRLDLLQMLFAGEMSKVDPEFFVRLNQSRLHKEDRTTEGDYRWPLFNGSDFNEKDYYKQFPTIYHLRLHLCESTEKEDIRLIYLALHNIVKHRGNFLYQDTPSLSAKNSNLPEVVESFCATLEDWCNEQGRVSCSCKPDAIARVLQDPRTSKRDKQEELQKLLGVSSGEDTAYAKQLAKGISQAIVGYVADFSQIFPTEGSEGNKFALSNDEKVNEYLMNAGCSDEALPVFESLQAVYSSFVLAGILKNANGGTISSCKVQEYEKYKADLALLKELVKVYAPDKYRGFFGGEYYKDTKRYDPLKSGAYTKYDSVHSAGSYDELKKAVKKLLEATEAVSDHRYKTMMKEFEEETFLRRLKTSDNGSIPFQLHLEEMQAIIDRQAQFYPFLEADRKKLTSLVSFRIPYYVGPLTMKNAARDKHQKARFAWAARKPGMEKERIYPWNWEEIIDKNKSAENFIRRMTGICTYLQGEPVLPKCSLLYEEFCVLNEFNGSYYTQDGDDHRRFDYADRQGIIRDLFKKKKVSYKDVETWMKQNRSLKVRVAGGQGESGYESKLSSYIFFCKDIFHVDELSPTDYPMLEEIILWNTLFEDRSILKEKIAEKYGDRFSAEQIKKICKKRFSGWGRLSKKFLTGLKVQTDTGERSIMDVLREGNPNNGGRSHAMVLMQVLRDDKLRFQDVVDEENRKHVGDASELLLEELPGSPALRRSVNQAIRIVEEIVSIAKCAPSNIFIEYTRDDDMTKKGKRTSRRYDALRAAVEVFKAENPGLYRGDLLGDLKRVGNGGLDERLTLYFMQGGKSLYSNTPIDINDLHDTTRYQVDHIIPQSYVKDDSFENKALVLSGENQRKSSAMLLDEGVRKEMGDYWRALHDAGLIGDKKYNNLMRSSFSDNQMRGFIARQLVETSQIVKFVAMMLESKYPAANIHPIKASLSSQLRDAEGYVKCRDLNDYHHAHDALLACEMGRFITLYHPGIFSDPMRYAQAMRQFVKRQQEELKRTSKAPGNSAYLVSSFLSTVVDEDTGEVLWDAQYETDRIRKYLNYKDCYISRMPEETSGAYWDATIYSPHGGKHAGTIPLKRNLPVEKYGGYASSAFAYFMLYLAKDARGKDRAILTGVPVPLARRIAQDGLSCQRFAEADACTRGLTYCRTLRGKILKYARVEVGSDQFYVPALDAVYSAKQLVLSEHMTAVAAATCNDKVDDAELPSEELLALYDQLTTKLGFLCSKFGNVVSAMEKGRDVFAELATNEMRAVLRNVLRFAKATTARVDLSLIGGPKNAGGIRSSVMTNDVNRAVFVDQSVTGMFERRTRIEL